MQAPLGRASDTIMWGLIVAIALLLVWIVVSGVDLGHLIGFLFRWLHVVGAIAWIGMVLFVNIIQIPALAEASDEGRRTLLSAVVPKVATMFRHASTLTLVTGAALLVTSGYVAVGGSIAAMPLRSVMMWLSSLAGLAMWAFVHMRIWPNLKIVLSEEPLVPVARAEAREVVHRYARLNLLLAIPVSALMVAAPHLY